MSSLGRQSILVLKRPSRICLKSSPIVFLELVIRTEPVDLFWNYSLSANSWVVLVSFSRENGSFFALMPRTYFSSLRHNPASFHREFPSIGHCSLDCISFSPIVWCISLVLASPTLPVVYSRFAFNAPSGWLRICLETSTEISSVFKMPSQTLCILTAFLVFLPWSPFAGEGLNHKYNYSFSAFPSYILPLWSTYWIWMYITWLMNPAFN